MEWVIAAILAGVLTLVDLDRTFYPSPQTQTRDKVQLYAWYVGFILANAGLAIALYFAVDSLGSLRDWKPWFRALIVGAGYLALVRLKLTTVNVGGSNTPVGLELVYEGAKDFVYKRINRIARDANYKECMALAERDSLADLLRRAKIMVDLDALLPEETKLSHKAWLLRVARDTTTDELERRATIAYFILSGRRSAGDGEDARGATPN